MAKDKYEILENIVAKREKETYETLKEGNTLSKETVQNLLSLSEAKTQLDYEATLDYIMVFPELEKVAPYILKNTDVLLGSRLVTEDIHYNILKQELFYLFMEKYNVEDPYEKLYYFIKYLSKENYLTSDEHNHTIPKYEENSLRILFSIDLAHDLSFSEAVQILSLVQSYHYDYMDKNVSPYIENEEFDINKCIKKVTEIITDNQKSKQK